jgi:hypothetical protein
MEAIRRDRPELTLDPIVGTTTGHDSRH